MIMMVQAGWLYSTQYTSICKGVLWLALQWEKNWCHVKIFFLWTVESRLPKMSNIQLGFFSFHTYFYFSKPDRTW